MWLERSPRRPWNLGALLLGAAPVVVRSGEPQSVRDGTLVRGMTISCQTWGREWGTDGFVRELEVLHDLGVNWVAIHPYAGIRGDGSLEWREMDPANPPEWLARPIREAHARGMSILVVTHIAQWGSPWKYRGEIDFADAAATDRFFADYTRFISSVAACTPGADGLSVASELDRLCKHEDRWRAVIASVRAVTTSRLTWAASWNCYHDVRFWDALDAIGIQAYFPLSTSEDPGTDELQAAWSPILADLRALHERTGKPVVFTELGYNRSLAAAREPWAYAEEHGEAEARAEALQTRCLETALRVIEPESSWLRGAILWKWFVGSSRNPNGRHRENFLMSAPALQGVIASVWSAASGSPRPR
ncbi:MAG: hypothetical protein NTY35_16830 [Planctomycetota bacterium]|nr:hypothetical protein [Planctomycetota bacterium]